MDQSINNRISLKLLTIFGGFSLPVLAASGKLDKKALPPFPQGRKTEKGQPASKTEEFLESVWKEILQVDFIDVEESFFELGG